MIEGLNALINEAIANGVMPGANYALIVKGKKTFGSFGNKALFPEVEKNALDTIYDMASVSKVMITTTAIMMLCEQGKLRLFDSVSLYVKDFKHTDITIWDLLTHSSGLPADISRSTYENIEGLMDHLMSVELKYEKNTKIVYSDIGFMLLGFVIEAVSQLSLDVFAKDYILTPLEMNDSGYNPQDTLRCAPTEDRKTHIDRGYVHDEKAHQLNGVAGHAGLFSTVSDVSHFMEMILAGGVYKGKRILSQQTIDLLFTPQVEEKSGIKLVGFVRGLGWILKGEYPVCGDLASNQTIMHTGFTGTHLFIDRVNEVAFCMLSNRVHPTRDNNLLIPLRGKLGNYIMSKI